MKTALFIKEKDNVNSTDELVQNPHEILYGSIWYLCSEGSWVGNSALVWLAWADNNNEFYKNGCRMICIASQIFLVRNAECGQRQIDCRKLFDVVSVTTFYAITNLGRRPDQKDLWCSTRWTFMEQSSNKDKGVSDTF